MDSSSSASAVHSESARCSERSEMGEEEDVEVEVKGAEEEEVEGGETMDWRNEMRDSLGMDG